MNTRLIRFLVYVLGAVSLAGFTPAFAAAADPIPSYAPMFSDFNGDNQIDQVTLTSEGSTKHIRITLGKSTSRLLHFETEVNERGRLYYGDFDNDGDIDLIWSSQTNPGSQIIWAGDGRGNFSKLSRTDEAAHSFECSFESEPPSKTIDDSDAQTPACVISSVFCGGPIHAPPRLQSPGPEKRIHSDGQSSLSAYSGSVSAERGPPGLPSSY
jgi:hypothetical protein